MNTYEIDVNVYSVVTIPTEDVERVTSAYLYDATTVVESFDLPNTRRVANSAVVLKSAVTATYGRNPHDLATTFRDTAASAIQLATYQIDRLASGLHPGRVCGTLADAHEFVTSIL